MEKNAVTYSFSDDLFGRILATSPRKAREILFSRYGIKGKKRIGLPHPSDALEKVQKLHLKLKNTTNEQELNLVNELVRNWLYNQRPMLKSALDFLGVENNNGLVDVETDFFDKLDKEKAEKLLQHLIADYSEEEVRVYLKFMNVAI